MFTAATCSINLKECIPSNSSRSGFSSKPFSEAWKKIEESGGSISPIETIVLNQSPTRMDLRQGLGGHCDHRPLEVPWSSMPCRLEIIFSPHFSTHKTYDGLTGLCFAIPKRRQEHCYASACIVASVCMARVPQTEDQKAGS